MKLLLIFEASDGYDPENLCVDYKLINLQEGGDLVIQREFTCPVIRIPEDKEEPLNAYIEKLQGGINDN